jgi:hypothetical protein
MHPHRKTGGKQPRGYGNVPHFSQLRRKTARTIPETCCWLTNMPDDLGMMLNDKLGCCSISAQHHARQIWTFNATGQMITDADSCIESDYESFCGYMPGNPQSDRGGVMQTVLTRAMQRGMMTATGRDKLQAFVEIDPRHPQDIREVIAFGGIAYTGIEDIPEAWTDAQPGDTWDITDSPGQGGHCVILAGYDADGFDVISWGLRFRLTNAAFARYCDEAYWLADRNWIKPNGMTPGGLTDHDIGQAMLALQQAA